MVGRGLEPIRIPDGFWERADVTEALRAREIGQLFKLVKRYSGASQTKLGTAVGLAQGQVSPIISGTRKVTMIDVLERIAGGLRMPDQARMLIGLAPQNTSEHVGAEQALNGDGHEWKTLGAEYPQKPSTGVALLGQLTTRDLADDPVITSAGWDASAMAGTIAGYLFGQPGSPAAEPPNPPQDAYAATAIRAMAQHLTDLDFKFGGGHIRRTLLFYFQSGVVPLLHARHPEAVRRQIFRAAAEVAEVLGWSTYDAGRHGAAQRYLIQALHLSREAQDHMLGATILSNLSHQANYLGHLNDAVQLARAGQSEALGKSSPTVHALLLAMEARALASAGRERECTGALLKAEKAFQRRDPSADQWWIDYFTLEELAGESAHCFRDLGKPEETRKFATLAIDPTNTPPRTQAFIGMVRAAGELSAGNIDDALDTAAAAVELAGPLQSNRYIRYLADFYRTLASANTKHSLATTFANQVQRHYPTLNIAATQRR